MMRTPAHALVMLVPLAVLGLLWMTAARSGEDRGSVVRSGGPARDIAAGHEVVAGAGWDNWLAAYEANPGCDGLRALGLAMAAERRAAMRAMMRDDPDRALRAALPFGTYRRLPGYVRLRIERPFAVAGRLDVSIGCGGDDDGGQVMRYRADLDGVAHEVFPVRGREGMMSKEIASLSGIRLDGLAVLERSPLRRIAGDEAADAAAVLGVEAPGEALDGADEVLLAAGRMWRASKADAEAWERAFVMAERIPGPTAVSEVIAALDGGGPDAPQQAMTAAAGASESWTTGVKRMLFIRLDFSDLPGEPVSVADLRRTLADCTAQFASMSYGRVQLETEVTPKVYRAGTSSSAQQDAYQLRDAARALAAADYDLGSYDVVVYAFPKLSWSWLGMASVGGRHQWLNGDFSQLVIVHETGHNYGLNHANWWRVGSGENPAAESGFTWHYGDPFDAMGNIHAGEFHVRSRVGLGWTEPGEHLEVSEPGVYRLHRFDSAEASGGGRLLGLRVRHEAMGLTSHDYWLGYRREPTVFGNRPTGVQVIRDMPQVWYSRVSGGTWLLDMTPGSSVNSHLDRSDAFLEVGRSFIDPQNLLTMTAMARGGSGIDEWIGED